jgi:GNAT superfamily N-acetyltransferase
MHEIQLAGTDAEIAATFDLMAQLRPHLRRPKYMPLIRSMTRECGYRLAVLRDGGSVCAVAGFRITRSLAWGQYVYIDDLICDEHKRSHGHGAALLEWIARLGKAQGCTELHLDSGVQRHGAHRFYLCNRMDITCYHFRLGL